MGYLVLDWDNSTRSGKWGVVALQRTAFADLLDSIAKLNVSSNLIDLPRNSNYQVITGGAFSLGNDPRFNTIDFHYSCSNLTGPSNLGIYLYENDVLTLCLSDSNKQLRPDLFESTNELMTSKVTYKQEPTSELTGT